MSLRLRLVLAASLVLAGFLGATGWSLYVAFRESAEAGLRERLLGQVYALLAAVDADDRGRMQMPRSVPDPRLSRPDSGLYALVSDARGRILWRSPSLTGHHPTFLRPQAPGARAYHEQNLDGQRLYVLDYGIDWEDDQGAVEGYTFSVAVDLAPLREEAAGFAASLWRWLGGLALSLIFAQGLILTWGLRPLRRVATDLERIERGEAERLEGRYPRELRGLTTNLNALIESGRAAQRRYRHSLDDLAHSMKTPLAVLRNAARLERGEALRASVEEQVQRMDGIVQHQLRRALSSGQGALTTATPAAPPLERLARALAKVHRDKTIQTDLDPGARFFGDPADLMEVAGNLLENACKYGHREIRLVLEGLAPEPGAHRPGLLLMVEDDGPGIPTGRAREVLERGRRMDQRAPGQGIGLAVVAEIATANGAHLEIARGDLGGARILFRIPPR